MVRTSIAVRHVYEGLYQLCTPYALPGPWHTIPSDPDVKVCPPPGKLLPRLVQLFSHEDLVRSRIARAKSTGELIPSGILVEGSPLLFLRSRPGVVPLDVIGQHGGLSGLHLPIIAVLSDHHTRRALSKENVLLVCGSLEDVAVLRALDLPAALAAGLDSIDCRQLARVCSTFGWKRSRSAKPESHDLDEPAPHRDSSPVHRTASPPYAGSAPPVTSGDKTPPPTAADPAPPFMALVGWSPSRLTLERPPGLKAIQKLFCGIRDFLGRDQMDVGIWIAKQQSLERLAFELNYEPWAVRAGALFTDFEESSRDALYVAPEPPAPVPAPANFVEAEQEYRQAVRQHGQGRCSAERLRRAREAYDALLDSEVVQPLSRLPASPMMANLRMLLMPLLRSAHGMALSVESMVALVRVEDLLRGEQIIPPARLNELLSFVKMIVALSKELRP